MEIGCSVQINNRFLMISQKKLSFSPNNGVTMFRYLSRFQIYSNYNQTRMVWTNFGFE